MIKKWETLGNRKVADLKIFSADMVTRKHPDWNKQSDFVVLNSPLWVNIMPITKDRKLVLIEQYRHGSDSITLEIPGGLIEHNEDPRLAGQRECMEETGFGSDKDAEQLGITKPNPAFLNNICYSYVWFDCIQISNQALDGNEDINIRTVPLDNVWDMIRTGEIDHSLVMNAFFYYSLKYGLNK